jgi:hypothetical protein
MSWKQNHGSKNDIYEKYGRLYHLDYKKNSDIMEELNTQPIMEFTENY